MMSKSTSKGIGLKRSSLARSYDLFFCNKMLKEQKASGKGSYVLTAESKLLAAEKYLVEHHLESEAGGSVNAECGGADVSETGATGSDWQDGSAQQSQDPELSGNSAAAKKDKLKFAETLVDPDLMWSRYFSGLLDNCFEAVEENLMESDVDLESSMEREEGKRRMKHRAATACSLPIKLILTPLHRVRTLARTFASRLEMQFGPLHASLQVGQVVLEWNDSSLVTPYPCDYQDGIFRVNLEKHSRWMDYVSHHHSSFEAAAASLNLAGQTEQIFVIASKKTEMITSLIDVIIKYNRFYYYNLIDRNCQHFVKDCLDALGVQFPNEFKGGLQDYFKQLVAGCTPDIPKKFKTHRDLDKYVESQDLTSMPQHDLEFLLVLYFRFHLESKDKLKENRKLLEEWVCQEQHCKMDEVEHQVKDQSLLIHKFPPIHQNVRKS